MKYFEVGERVRVKDTSFAKTNELTVGGEGTVVENRHGTMYILVKLDEGNYSDRDGVHFNANELERVCPQDDIVVGTMNDGGYMMSQPRDNLTIYNMTLGEASNGVSQAWELLEQLLAPVRFTVSGDGTTTDSQFESSFNHFSETLKAPEKDRLPRVDVPRWWTPEAAKSLAGWGTLGDGSTTSTEVDMVNHPPHYTTGNIEVLDYIEDHFSDDYLGGQVVKYISRYRTKGTAVQDLEKAAFYLARLIKNTKEGN